MLEVTTHWETRSTTPCDHPAEAKIPGLDATACKLCQVWYKTQLLAAGEPTRARRKTAEPSNTASLFSSNQPTIEVVSLKSNPKILQQPGAVYIGRQTDRYYLKESVLHNPFKIDREGDRNTCCEYFIVRVLSPALESRTGAIFDELSRLADRVLAGESLTLVCWCAPERCHGFDIAAAIRQLVYESKSS